MTRFERILNGILSEMPLKHQVAGERDAEGKPWKYGSHSAINVWSDKDYRTREDNKGFGGERTSENDPRHETFKAWASPKFLDTLSKKVSRLTNHNILLYVGGHILDAETVSHIRHFSNAKAKPYHQDIAAKRIGISPEEASNSIIVNIVGYGGGQDIASPWIILHQVSEAIMNNTDVTDYVERLFPDTDSEELFSDYEDLTFYDAVCTTVLAPYHDKIIRAHKLEEYSQIPYYLYPKLFKFKSAQSSEVDIDQELLTEYMWHGYIRINQVEGIPKAAIMKIKKYLETICDQILEDHRGMVIDNSLF